MKNINKIVEDLRKDGWRVTTTHFRPDVTYPDTMHEYNRHTKDVVVTTCGGYTTVILSRDGKVFVGVSTCHEKDTFNYKIGRKIALHRAMIEAGLKKVTKGVNVTICSSIVLQNQTPEGWAREIADHFFFKSDKEIKRMVEDEWAFPKEIPDMYIYNVLKGAE